MSNDFEKGSGKGETEQGLEWQSLREVEFGGKTRETGRMPEVTSDRKEDEKAELRAKLKGEYEWDNYLERPDLGIDEWKELAPEPGTPEYRRLVFESLEGDVRGYFEPILKMGQDLAKIGVEGFSFDINPILDKVGAGEDICIDPESRELRVGKRAEQTRRWYHNKHAYDFYTLEDEDAQAKLVEEGRRGDEEKSKINPDFMAFAGRVLGLCASVTNDDSHNGDAPQFRRYSDLHEKVEQNMADGFYREADVNGKQISSEPREGVKTIAETREGLEKRKLAGDLAEYGSAIEDYEPFQKKLAELDAKSPEVRTGVAKKSELRRVLEAAMEGALALAPNNGEAYDFVRGVQKDILDGFYDGVRRIDYDGDRAILIWDGSRENETGQYERRTDKKLDELVKAGVITAERAEKLREMREKKIRQEEDLAVLHARLEETETVEQSELEMQKEKLRAEVRGLGYDNGEKGYSLGESPSMWRFLEPQLGTKEFSRLVFETLPWVDRQSPASDLDLMVDDLEGRLREGESILSIIDPETGNTVVGASAEEVFARDRARFRSPEGEVKYRAEYAQVDDGVKGILNSGVRLIFSVLGGNDLGIGFDGVPYQEFIDRVNQNVADGVYREAKTGSYENYYGRLGLSDTGAQFAPDASLYGEIFGERQIWEDGETYHKIRLAQDLAWTGHTVDTNPEFLAKWNGLNSEVKGAINAAILCAQDLARDDYETYKLIEAIDKKVMDGFYDGKKIRKVEGLSAQQFGFQNAE